MYQIQVWLAPPAKCNDSNCIGDIVLKPRDPDGLGPVGLAVQRPDVQGRVPQHLNLGGVSQLTLLYAVAEAINLVSAAVPPLPTRLTGKSCDAITLTVDDPRDPTARSARLMVSPKRGRPFQYRATWEHGNGDWFDEVVVRLAVTNSDPWELLDLICKAFMNVRVSCNVIALEFHAGYEAGGRYRL